ncbi:MAG: tetratricopeptide repeat protein, partial [Bacteroidia bacterium]
MITRIFAGLIFLLSINAGNALAQMTRKDSLELKLKTVKGNERVDVLVGLVKLIYKNDLPQGKKLLAEAESLSVSYPRGKVDILCRKAGFAWFEKKDASQEIAYYNEALTLAESISYEAAIPDIYSNICASLCDLSKFDECHKVIERGFKWADKAKDEYLRAKILQQEGVAEYYQGHVEQALVICEKSLALFEKLKVKREVAGTGMNIGVMKYRLGQTEESLQYYDKALKAALELKDSGITAKVYVNIGLSESRLGKDEKAIVRFKDAEVIYRKIKDMKNASGALENAGVSYLNMGKPAQALKCLLESAKIKETEKNLIDLASSYLNIGSCYENLHDTAKTIEFSIKAKDLYHEAGNEYFYAHALRSLGALYSSMRQFDKAKKYLDEAMEIQKRLGDMPGYGNTLLTYGNYYKFQNDNVNALKYYKQALAIEEKVGEKINIAGLVNNLGKICFDAGRYSESAEYYQRALAMRREIKNMRGVAESYLSLADVFGRLKDFKKAYEYEVLYHKTWDSLNSKDIVGQMAEMNAKYETAKKDKEIIERKTAEKVANAKAEKESLERKNAENKFLFAILGVSLLIALAGFVIRGNIQRKKANVLLTSQNNEITKQKSEIEEQKLLVEEKQKEIIDSITYAKRLQEAILPSVQSIKDQL